jgi:hypothetical protein
VNQVDQPNPHQDQDGVMPGLSYQSEKLPVLLKKGMFLIFLLQLPDDKIKDPPGSSRHNKNEEHINDRVQERILVKEEFSVLTFENVFHYSYLPILPGMRFPKKRDSKEFHTIITPYYRTWST